MKEKNDVTILNRNEILELTNSVKSSSLSEGDKNRLLDIISSFNMVCGMVQTNRASLAKIRKVLGLSTEKLPQAGLAPDETEVDLSSPEEKKSPLRLAGLGISSMLSRKR